MQAKMIIKNSNYSNKKGGVKHNENNTGVKTLDKVFNAPQVKLCDGGEKRARRINRGFGE